MRKEPNALIHTHSPYLHQHAYNPVDWLPWSEEALAKARHEQKPIFLSIGYSTCHWCHVMERESFEDLTIAKVLNEHFIPIKVDREERPDLDRYFQEVYQRINRRAGGWPLSVFLTHEGYPFYAATYIPPRMNGRSWGFLELLETISRQYASDRATLINEATLLTKSMKKERASPGPLPSPQKIAQRFLAQAESSYDPIGGGFGAAPKFPHASTLKMLLYLSSRYQGRMKSQIRHTLEQMALGGLRDLVDGGFCRYSTDRIWLVPHFEKMLYDNALLIELYALAAKFYDEPLFMQIAEECADFLEERMREGLFYASASDADSDGHEGAYFVYSYDEAYALLQAGGFSDKKIMELFGELGITPEGNFEHHSIVRAKRLALSLEAKEALKLFKQARTNRTYPFIDRKILVAWNAMAARALFVLGRSERASELLKVLLERYLSNEELYHGSLAEHQPTIKGYLEDYAWLASALIEGYLTTADAWMLNAAEVITTKALALFYREGRWLFGGEFDGEESFYESSYPGGTALMAEVLAKLGIIHHPKYTTLAQQTLSRHARELEHYPFAAPTALMALLLATGDSLIAKAPKSDHHKIEEAAIKAGLPILIMTSPRYELCDQHSCLGDFATVDALINAIAQRPR
ncbi:MAG: thioredoxin domain-containing protein [Campylobacterales bacterium]